MNITKNLPTGVSIESASYIENNNLADSKDYSSINDKNEAEYVPKLFSEEQNYQADENNLEINDQENNERNQL